MTRTQLDQLVEFERLHKAAGQPRGPIRVEAPLFEAFTQALKDLGPRAARHTVYGEGQYLRIDPHAYLPRGLILALTPPTVWVDDATFLRDMGIAPL